MWRDFDGRPSIIGLRSAGASAVDFSTIDGVARDLQLTTVRFTISPPIVRTLLRFMASNTVFEIWMGRPALWMEFAINTLRHCHIIHDGDGLRCLLQFQFAGEPGVHQGNEVHERRFSYRPSEWQPLTMQGVYIGHRRTDPDGVILSYVEDVDRSLQLLYLDRAMAGEIRDAVHHLGDQPILMFTEHEVSGQRFTKVISVRPNSIPGRQSLVLPHRLICYDTGGRYDTVAIPTRMITMTEDLSHDRLVEEAMGPEVLPVFPTAEDWEW